MSWFSFDPYPSVEEMIEKSNADDTFARAMHAHVRDGVGNIIPMEIFHVRTSALGPVLRASFYQLSLEQMLGKVEGKQRCPALVDKKTCSIDETCLRTSCVFGLMSTSDSQAPPNN